MQNFATKTVEYAIDNAVIDELKSDIDGDIVYIRSYNPHGFYRIHFDKGRLPMELSGNYTSKALAESEAKKYFAHRRKNVAIVSPRE